ncbi:TPA: hypothetical protein L5632_006809, partial [Pseudomonas aeruginosa]|nr:hypothetical protein [Pseudomonas aeruginosa]
MSNEDWNELDESYRSALSGALETAHPAVEQAGGDERAKFEYWASDEGIYPKAIERSGNCYKLAQTQSYWMAWQARAALAHRAPEVCSECSDTGKVYDESGDGPWSCYACTGNPKVIGYANGDELDNMLDDRTAVLSPGKTSFHNVPVYRLIRAALAQPSPAQSEQHWPKLEKPAQVGAIRFRAGLSSRLVVEAAQRLYEFESTPEKEAERIERLHAFREQCFEPLGAEFSKVLSENLVELSSEAKHEQAEAEAGRPEVVARVVHSNPVVLGQCGPLNANDELMTVAQHAASVARWAEMFNRVEQERDAALAEVVRLTGVCASLDSEKREMEHKRDAIIAMLDAAMDRVSELEKQEPVALANRGLHAFWVKWTEAAAGLYGPGIKLYAAPVAQAQHSAPDVCDGKEQDAFEEWARKEGLDTSCHPMHWLFLDAKTNSARQGWKAALRYVRAHIAAPAKAQHSVPETINEEANSFLRIADAGQFKDNAVAVRTAAVIIRGLLHRPPLMQSIIRHRICLTPEYEGQWHADLYGEDGEVQHHAEADTPDEAVRAVVAL